MFQQLLPFFGTTSRRDNKSTSNNGVFVTTISFSFLTKRTTLVQWITYTTIFAVFSTQFVEELWKLDEMRQVYREWFTFALVFHETFVKWSVYSRLLEIKESTRMYAFKEWSEKYEEISCGVHQETWIRRMKLRQTWHRRVGNVIFITLYLAMWSTVQESTASLPIGVVTFPMGAVNSGTSIALCFVVKLLFATTLLLMPLFPLLLLWMLLLLSLLLMLLLSPPLPLAVLLLFISSATKHIKQM